MNFTTIVTLFASAAYGQEGCLTPSKYVSKVPDTYNQECEERCHIPDFDECSWCGEHCMPQEASWDQATTKPVFPEDQPQCWDRWVHGYSEMGALTSVWASVGIVIEDVADGNECQNLCQREPTCVRWTYRMEGFGVSNRQKHKCVLKNQEEVTNAMMQVLPDAMHPDGTGVWPPSPDGFDDPNLNYLPRAEDPRWEWCDLTIDYPCNRYKHGTPQYDCAVCGVGRCAYISDYHVAGPKYCDTVFSDICELAPDYTAPTEGSTEGGPGTETEPQSGGPCCDHPTWRNPLTPEEGNHSAYNRLCEDQNYRQCAELSNYNDVQSMCPKTCGDALGYVVDDDDHEFACTQWCDVEIPEKRMDCCDNPDYLYQNSTCEAQRYNCNLPEVQENCPMTCQTDELPWNQVSDDHCYDFCASSTTPESTNPVPPSTSSESVPPSTSPEATTPVPPSTTLEAGTDSDIVTVTQSCNCNCAHQFSCACQACPCHQPAIQVQLAELPETLDLTVRRSDYEAEQ